MAGAGYKLFNTGDVLTAAQVNTYLQEQAVMRFATTTARTTALSGVLAEGMVTYIDATDSLEFYNGSAWIAVNTTAGDITGITTGATSGLTGGVTSGTADLKLNTTAKGGLLVGTGSGTASELTVGSNNTVLTADSTTATGLKWAAASSGAITKITSASFSAVASVDVDSVFSTSYSRYIICVTAQAGTNGSAFQFRWRYAGPTTQASDYYGAGIRQLRDNTTASYGFANTAQATLMDSLGSGQDSLFWIYVNGVGNTSDKPVYYANGYTAQNQSLFQCTCYNDISRIYTGFRLQISAGTVSGNYQVFGVQN